jgi:hypothetical protein
VNTQQWDNNAKDRFHGMISNEILYLPNIKMNSLPDPPSFQGILPNSWKIHHRTLNTRAEPELICLQAARLACGYFGKFQVDMGNYLYPYEECRNF